ncbi:MAG: CHAT domain-containing protein [Saprospiraceae bacterium]|nr:CHAT domain-containing protein [Saprospiraceae bacterium]MCF8252065.1 CHAT domain-containing protein [Saprospiraceae bacterium]MCF8281771.1 CHAT domain-containing protein [Bacteroidales bacterium]MCF8313708.1 CHAT domain-containing protein [Saprospiraceae bacterium]MCF8442415.1 CHAT domain-containing protein [Saprospiraceae bacterium]
MKTNYALLLFLALSFSTGFAQQKLDDVAALVKEKKYEEAGQVLNTLLPAILPADTSAFAEAHLLVSRIHYYQGKYPECIASYESLAAYLPAGHPDLGDCYFECGNAYMRSQNMEKFVECNKHAAAAYAASQGAQSIEYTKALNSLGFGYQFSGEYKEAEKVLLEARRIKEKNGVFDVQYGRILNQLGNGYTRLNKFQEAEECIAAALKVKESTRGKNNDYAKGLFNYSMLLQAMGRDQNALEKIDEAIAIGLKDDARTEELDGYRQIKASLLKDMNKQQKATSLYEEILQNKLTYEEEKSSNYAKVLLALSNLYAESDNLPKALELCAEAVDIFKKIHGEKHPYYALALIEKADLLLKKGETTGLEAMYKTASAIISQKYSRNHIEYFKSEYAYFLFLKKTKEYSQAIEKIQQIDNIITKHIVDAAKYLSIRELVEITALYHDYFQQILSLTSLNPGNQVLTSKALDCSLFYKGFVLESMLKIKKAIKQSKEITDYSEQLTEQKLNLSEELDKEEKDNVRIAALQDKIASVEVEMSRSLGRLRQEDEQLSWDLVRFELSDSEAAIDFVRFQSESGADFLYAAMLILSNAEAPVFVPLFLESDLTKYFDKKLTTSDGLIQRLYSWPKRSATPLDTLLPVSLYDLILKPLAPHLDGIGRIYYVSDGILHNLALHAIPTALDSVVSDKIQFLQMTSFRNLILKKKIDYSQKKKKALLMGGLKYGSDSGGTRGDRNNRRAWNDLPWTEKEVDEISGILQKTGYSTLLLKGEAPQKHSLQEHVSQNPDLQLIHFATHGFFTTEDLLQVKSKIDVDKTNLELTQSGLVLANANAAESGDALITAFEISEMELSQTDLVVLSACDTGLGQVYENEGVYGMQRAFKIAGAEYIIMSLWKVDDRDTKVFMTDFYRNYLEKGMTIENAFYATQKMMKESVFYPVKWAGFVLLK